MTGGAGFIASHIVDKYLSLGHKVVIVDDLSTGRLQNLNKGATFYHTSITKPGLEEIFEREQPEIVNHHAAQISVAALGEDPAHDAEVNIQAQSASWSYPEPWGREFVFASSGGAIYGEPQYVPCDEAHPITPFPPTPCPSTWAKSTWRCITRYTGWSM